MKWVYFLSKYHNFAHLLFENPLKFFDHGRIYGTKDRFACLQANAAVKFQFKEYYSISIHVYDTARHTWAIDYCLCHVIRKPYQDFVAGRILTKYVTSLHPTLWI